MLFGKVNLVRVIRLVKENITDSSVYPAYIACVMEYKSIRRKYHCQLSSVTTNAIIRILKQGCFIEAFIKITNFFYNTITDTEIASS